MNFAYHLIKSNEMISGPLDCVSDYMEWYFRISHLFVLSTNKDSHSYCPTSDTKHGRCVGVKYLGYQFM